MTHFNTAQHIAHKNEEDLRVIRSNTVLNKPRSSVSDSRLCSVSFQSIVGVVGKISTSLGIDEKRAKGKSTTTTKKRLEKNTCLVKTCCSHTQKPPTCGIWADSGETTFDSCYSRSPVNYSDRFSAIQTSLEPNESSAVASGTSRLDGQCLRPGLGTMRRGALGADGGPPGPS